MMKPTITQSARFGVAGVLAAIGVTTLLLPGSNPTRSTDALAAPAKTAARARKTAKVVKTDAQWRALLSPAQYDVLRAQGTERAGTGTWLHEKRAGTFKCAGCDAPLFQSKTKFESGTGWPSFYQAMPGRVAEKTDVAWGMKRTEVLCARCDGHLGHVFDDGPKPTGLRYCMNSIALKFDAARK